MDLIISLLERLGIFAILFIFLFRYQGFQRLIVGNASYVEKVTLSLLFGLAGVAATYGGLPFYGAIANLRGVAVALAGILGGPFVGLFSGGIAGIHRYLMNPEGLTSLSCGLATVLQGLLAGILYMKFRRRSFDPLIAALIGAVNELLKMALILLFARPLIDAMILVEKLAVPSMLVNGLGIAVFVQLLSAVYREQELSQAKQAQKSLDIAHRTLPHLRNGLSQTTAQAAATIIQEMTRIDAVAISNGSELLAFEEEHPRKRSLSDTAISEKMALASLTGQTLMIEKGADFNSIDRQLDFESAIIVPLWIEQDSVGSLGLFRSLKGGTTKLDTQLAKGLSQLFSAQLALAEVDNQKSLAAEAEIKALQAQINPHFFFNALNTINSFTRSDPDVASNLLVRLSDFFRRNIDVGTTEIPLKAELDHCRSYLDIEKARFRDRLEINVSVEDNALQYPIPPFILQPLVENSVRHGILPLKQGGKVSITVTKSNQSYRFAVTDNGVGICPVKLGQLQSDHTHICKTSGLGIALKNIRERIKAIYGSDHDLIIDSQLGGGTTVSFTLPIRS